MSGELQLSYASGKTVYCLIRNRIGQVWNTSSSAFEAYLTASYANYVVALTEQGSASAYYTGTFPSAISAGIYDITAKNQSSGTPAETDTTVGVGDFQWNGTVTFPLSDLATSGQIGQMAPLRIARGVMIKPFSFYLKSSTDHITPFTSGVVSGQIARDGGSFNALQSGAFTEQGLGFFSLQALTSGDLLATSIALLFMANGISGGTSDPLPMSFITQKVSGVN